MEKKGRRQKGDEDKKGATCLGPKSLYGLTRKRRKVNFSPLVVQKGLCQAKKNGLVKNNSNMDLLSTPALRAAHSSGTNNSKTDLLSTPTLRAAHSSGQTIVIRTY